VKLEFSGSYPGWTNSNSEILDVLVPIYEKQNVKNQSSGVSRRIRMWNSGRQLSDMDMISFGPTIHGTFPDEEQVFLLLRNSGVLEILANIPVK
jgi:dipeptidase D